jgi:NIPSNAP
LFQPFIGYSNLAVARFSGQTETYKAVPARNKISPLLTAMSSVTGAVTRFTHIWPYKSLEDRGRLRAKAMDEGVWPPPGGPDQLAVQQTDIYLPASFSPIR